MKRVCDFIKHIEACGGSLPKSILECACALVCMNSTRFEPNLIRF